MLHWLEQPQDLLAVASVSTGDGDAALARMLASPEHRFSGFS